MTPHENCANWEYKKHPAAKKIDEYCSAVTTKIRTVPGALDSFLSDTRPAHLEMFKEVAPAACSYLAGNYRGDNFPCLADYRVFILSPAGAEPGMIPVGVSIAMRLLHEDLLRDLESIEQLRADTENPVKPEALDLMLIEFLTHHMVTFLSIHPYANGNGHIGRMLMWVGLGRSKLWPRRWNISARPGWDELIRRFRSGNTKPLLRFVLASIRG